MILVSQERIKDFTDKGWWGTDSLVDLFMRNCNRTPGATALVDPPNKAAISHGEPMRLTYTEVKNMVEQLACGFLSIGVKKDDIVMIQMPNIVEFIITYLALGHIGAIISPIAAQYGVHEIRKTMAITNPKVFIAADYSGKNILDDVIRLQLEVSNLQTLIGHGKNLPQGAIPFNDLMNNSIDKTILSDYLLDNKPTANDIFTICWTSGTEASPKGVPRNHNEWLEVAKLVAEGCNQKENINLLNPFPFINMSALCTGLVPWCLLGGKMVMHHPIDLAILLDQLETEKIQYTCIVPSILNMLLQDPKILAGRDFSSLEVVGSGGAPLSPWMVKEFQEKYNIYVINMFNCNEGSPIMSVPSLFPDPEERAVYLPTTMPRAKTKLVNPANNETVTEKGVSGVLHYTGPATITGYYNAPDITANAFDAEGYYITGDMFTLDGKDGKLERMLFMGRSKDIIIRGGFNISAEELENIIIEHPNVAEVAAIGYPDEILGEKVCAVIAPKNGQDVTLDEIVEFFREKGVAKIKWPQKIMIVDKLPRNPVGKVIKPELRERVRLLK